jgi:alpha-galactosidase
MKIVLIGAGSFVFGPTVLRDALARHRMAGELVLVDLNLAVAEVMAGVGRRIARDLGVDCAVTATDDRRAALPGADAVILSAAPEGRRRWRMDYEIMVNAGVPEQVRECGGLGGLSYALRTVSLALDIAGDMEELCPDALFLDVTNPMPRVVTAVHRFTDIEAYGFCNVAQGGAEGYAWLAGLVGRTHDQIDVVTAGLNHFAWLISIQDRETGRDLYHDVETALRFSADPSARLLVQWLDRYGAVGVSGAGHMAEYIPPAPDIPLHTHPPFHGDAAEREVRLARLRKIADGSLDWRDGLTGGSWEHPVDLAVAVHEGATIRMPMLNLPNAGYLPELPDGRVVEVPVEVSGGEVRGVDVGVLPGLPGPPVEVGDLCHLVSDVHELVTEGAAKGDRQALVEAIRADPAIPYKDLALEVLGRILIAHRDLLHRFDY